MSANSLILSLHDSSVGSDCQPSALVSLSSLDLNRFGKQSLRYDRGKTPAITPPSLVLTETPYIIEAHILDETTRTHACTCSLQIPQSLIHMQHIHTHEIHLPLPNLLPLFFIFLSAASINQHKFSLCDDAIFTEVTRSIFLPLTLSSPALHLLCSSLHSAPGIPDTQHSPVSSQTAFNSPDHNAVTIATQVLLAEGVAALSGLWEALGMRTEMRCWRGRGDGAERKGNCAVQFFCICQWAFTEWL